ncbi:hypothetical protein CEXT_627821 [Caerostris extrusa]|uniref:Uncharacterized protein n=1 Tax=Caerostris extrusa TaxID=172846 RepID=A0AAV4XFY0_CAEEX|nr:hypothetical protein CEXT_627821 [Caerostris extrusa]
MTICISFGIQVQGVWLSWKLCKISVGRSMAFRVLRSSKNKAEAERESVAAKESSASSDIYKPLRGLFQSRDGRYLIDCERKPHPTSVDEVNFAAWPYGFCIGAAITVIS